MLSLVAQSKEQQKRVFAEVGDGGFSASDFEIIQQMGRLSVQRVSALLGFDKSGTNEK